MKLPIQMCILNVQWFYVLEKTCGRFRCPFRAPYFFLGVRGCFTIGASVRLRRSWSAPAWLTLHVCWPHQNTAGLLTWNVPRFFPLAWSDDLGCTQIIAIDLWCGPFKMRVSFYSYFNVFRSCILHWYTHRHSLCIVYVCSTYTFICVCVYVLIYVHMCI